MVSESIPPASASAMAARSTRSRLSGVRGFALGSVFSVIISTSWGYSVQRKS